LWTRLQSGKVDSRQQGGNTLSWCATTMPAHQCNNIAQGVLCRSESLRLTELVLLLKECAAPLRIAVDDIITPRRILTSCSSKATAVDEPLVLGQGAHSVVYKCRSGESGRFVAIKRPYTAIARSEATSPKARDQFKRCRNLHHDNIVGYIALGFEGNLVMEYVDGGSLADAIQRCGILDEHRVARMVTHVLRGLAHLHHNGIVHRDVKPANILIDAYSDTYKLCDWIIDEETREALDLRSSNPVGTPVFLAPEVVRSGVHCFQSDVWALGCTVINCVTGRLPWADEDNVFAAMFKTAHGHTPPFNPQHVSAWILDLLALCFEGDAAVRLDAQALLFEGGI
jgi:serine/threonine protein kinase